MVYQCVYLYWPLVFYICHGVCLDHDKWRWRGGGLVKLAGILLFSRILSVGLRRRRRRAGRGRLHEGVQQPKQQQQQQLLLLLLLLLLLAIPLPYQLLVPSGLGSGHF